VRRYRRSANADFNIHLAKRMTDRKPAQTNIERAHANVDKWLAEQEAYKARGEKTPWVLAMQRNLDEYKKPHGWLWWKWTFIKNRVYSIWVEIFRRSK
jgi:hypothetical protein